MYGQSRRPDTYLAGRNWCGTLEGTTDLSALKDHNVLVLLDEQNLSKGARDHGYRLDYDLLAKRIHAVANKADLRIFIALDPHDDGPARRFERLGYHVHAKTIRHLPLPHHQRRCDSNIDNLFAFWAGIHAVRTKQEVIVLGSGDYGLSGELAKAIRDRRCRRPVELMTLSLPGSTAQDLNAATNRCISANLEIGLDVLKTRGSCFKANDGNCCRVFPQAGSTSLAHPVL